MKGRSHEDSFFCGRLLSLFFVAVTAGALFIFSVKQLFVLLVIFVVTTFTLILLDFIMAIMKRSVKTEGHAGRFDQRSFLVTLVAFSRSCFLSGSKYFSVTFRTIVTINFRQFFLADIFNPHEFERHASVFFQMAGRTVFLFLFQDIGVLVV